MQKMKCRRCKKEFEKTVENLVKGKTKEGRESKRRYLRCPFCKISHPISFEEAQKIEGKSLEKRKELPKEIEEKPTFEDEIKRFEDEIKIMREDIEKLKEKPEKTHKKGQFNS